jgi:hypothetical protein
MFFDSDIFLDLTPSIATQTQTQIQRSSRSRTGTKSRPHSQVVATEKKLAIYTDPADSTMTAASHCLPLKRDLPSFIFDGKENMDPNLSRHAWISEPAVKTKRHGTKKARALPPSANAENAAPTETLLIVKKELAPPAPKSAIMPPQSSVGAAKPKTAVPICSKSDRAASIIKGHRNKLASLEQPSRSALVAQR